MFEVLDKLFKLHNALLLESRSIKAFFLYNISIFVIYLLTSTKQKQTNKVRPALYIGICSAFSIELAMLRLTSGVERQTFIINGIRLFYVLFSLVLVVYAACTYRDLEVLSYNMLKYLTEEFVKSQKNAALPWDGSDSDDDDDDDAKEDSDWITSVDTCCKIS